MANVALYQNKLNSLLQDPSSIKQDPSYQFGLDQALQAVQRSNSRQRGSGNALLDLVKMGEGYAASRYGENVDRLGRLMGQEQQYGLGQEQNRLTGVRDANSYDLGLRADTLGNKRADNDFTLGSEQNRLTGQRDANNFTLGNEQNRLTGVRDSNS
jgi:hypothetical protein